jgi:outer membrane protein
MKSRWILAAACALGSALAHAVNLSEVYERSLLSDPLWQQAIAQRLAIRETRTQALLNLLPVDLSANKDFAYVGSTNYSSPVYASLSLSVNVFNWNSWVALKAADATIAQAEANYQAAAQNLILRVSQQYFAVLAAQDTLAAQQSALQSVQTQLDQAQQRYDVGLIPVTDVETARASRDSTAASVIAAKRTLATQQDLLRAITDQTYATLAAPKDDMPLLNPEPASEDSWVGTAMTQNASLIASRLAADIAHDNLLTAYGGYAPSINVGVSRNWALQHNGTAPLIPTYIDGQLADLNTADLVWGVSVSVPLFASLNASKVRQARYSWEAAKSGWDYSSRQTEEQTRDAYQGVISQVAQVNALKAAVESNQVALEAIQAGYQVGTRTVVDVLTQRELLVSAETSFAQAKYAYLDDLVALRLAAGNLDRHTVEQINGWLAESAPGQTAPMLTVPAPPPIQSQP